MKMSTLKSILFTLLLFSTMALTGQSETVYYVSDFMSVAPGMHDDYRDCERAWKKIHQYKKDQGAIDGWALERITSPGGSDSPYNYVARQRFKSVEQLAAYQDNPYMPENWESLLTDEEIALVKRTSELRTWVKSEVWSTEERILADDADNSKIAVINYFSLPKGKTRADHLKMERDIWMPFHKKRIEAGNMKGWLLLKRELPIGRDYGAQIVTVDVYTDMAQFWEPFDIEAFEKLHPGKSMDDLWKMTMDAGVRSRAEIRRSLDSTN